MWVVFALTSLKLYHAFRDVRYENQVLLAVCGVGMVWQLLYFDMTVPETLGNYLPCLIQAAVGVRRILLRWQLVLENGGKVEETEDIEMNGLKQGMDEMKRDEVGRESGF